MQYLLSVESRLGIAKEKSNYLVEYVTDSMLKLIGLI
jgi:hypothetical protein